jgi:hypothetical protein
VNNSVERIAPRRVRFAHSLGMSLMSGEPVEPRIAPRRVRFAHSLGMSLMSGEPVEPRIADSLEWVVTVYCKLTQQRKETIKWQHV